MSLEKFNKVYAEIISEGIFKKAFNSFRSNKGKNKVLKEALQKWFYGNDVKQCDGKASVFDYTTENGEIVRFAFNEKEWKDEEAPKIACKIYAKDANGQKLPIIDNRIDFDYGFTESDINSVLGKKLKFVINQFDKSSLKTAKSKDKAAKNQRKAEDKAAKEAEKEKAKAENDARFEMNDDF